MTDRDTFEVWWLEQTRKGDPAHRLNLKRDAFIAGMQVARSRWMPIETAPKNGDRIWAWFPFSKQAYAISFRENVYEQEPNWTLDDGESACLAYDPPTHWQPLPTPPADAAVESQRSGNGESS
jgi:hypothetical protein